MNWKAFLTTVAASVTASLLVTAYQNRNQTSSGS